MDSLEKWVEVHMPTKKNSELAYLLSSMQWNYQIVFLNGYSLLKMTRYSIYDKDKLLYENLSEEEYFNTMEDLAADFYIDGIPNPQDLRTEFIEN